MIKRLAILVTFHLIGLCTLFAGRMDQILDAKTKKVHRIKVIPSENKIFLPNEYNSAKLKHLDRIEELGDRVILGVDFVYTSYAQVSSFDQRELNRKRLVELKDKAPDLIENPTIEWRKVIQTGASSPEEGKGFFHGFRITLRPATSEASRKEEKTFLKEALSSKGRFAELMEACRYEEDAEGEKEGMEKEDKERGTGIEGKSKASEADSLPKVEDYKEASVEEIAGMKKETVPFGTPPRFKGGKFKFFEHLEKNVFCPEKEELKEKGGLDMLRASFIVSPSGAIIAPAVEKGKEEACTDSIRWALQDMPPWEPGRHEGKPVMTQVILSMSFGRARPSTFIDTIKRVSLKELASEKDPFYSPALMDSLSDKAFSYPFFSAGGYDPSYIQECSVLKILKRNDWENILVVCDVTGSMSPYVAQLLLWYKKLFEAQEQEGSLQQISLFNDDGTVRHHRELDDFDDVKEFVISNFGGGGNIPENNVHGARSAIEKAGSPKEIVMIADNYATPHDLDQLEELERPVHLILCGTQGGVNPAYIDMVRKNGGTLHTIEKDLRELDEMTKGESVEINGITYSLKNGKVRPVH